MMERVAVDSSDIRSIGYDAESSVLEIEFKKGSVYQYSEVPAEEHAALMAAESKGKHFNANVKGRYGFLKL
jgi:hypothetical protein